MLKKVPAPNWGTAMFCAITSRGEDTDGWYSQNVLLTGHDPVAWVSAHGARMLAEAEGYTSPEKTAELQRDNEILKAQFDEAVETIRELRLQVTGIEGLAAAGFEVSKKTGRPPRTTEKPAIVSEMREKAEVKTRG